MIQIVYIPVLAWNLLCLDLIHVLVVLLLCILYAFCWFVYDSFHVIYMLFYGHYSSCVVLHFREILCLSTLFVFSVFQCLLLWDLVFIYIYMYSIKYYMVVITQWHYRSSTSSDTLEIIMKILSCSFFLSFWLITIPNPLFHSSSLATDQFFAIVIIFFSYELQITTFE